MAYQPLRAPEDGEVQVRRVDGLIEITCETAGAYSAVRLGEFNAWRAFALLAIILGIKLTGPLGKIRLG